MARLGISSTLAHKVVADLARTGPHKLTKPLANIVNKVQSWNLGQFLYLPAYRRIEQDLKSIFKGIEIEEKVREFRERFKKRERHHTSNSSSSEWRT